MPRRAPVQELLVDLEDKGVLGLLKVLECVTPGLPTASEMVAAQTRPYALCRLTDACVRVSRRNAI
jgi:hypothetical protein